MEEEVEESGVAQVEDLEDFYWRKGACLSRRAYCFGWVVLVQDRVASGEIGGLVLEEGIVRVEEGRLLVACHCE